MTRVTFPLASRATEPQQTRGFVAQGLPYGRPSPGFGGGQSGPVDGVWGFGILGVIRVLGTGDVVSETPRAPREFNLKVLPK